MTAHLVLRLDHYDVIVTENMFGDIISDLGAATVSGLGMAPSSEIGATAGLFQTSHGCAWPPNEPWRRDPMSFWPGVTRRSTQRSLRRLLHPGWACYFKTSGANSDR